VSLDRAVLRQDRASASPRVHRREACVPYCISFRSGDHQSDLSRNRIRPYVHVLRAMRTYVFIKCTTYFFFHALLAAAMRACMPLRGRCCTALLVVVVVFVSTVSLLVIIISQPHTTALVERGRRPARTKHTEKKERATLSRSLSHAREKIRARGVVILETSSPDLWKCVYACV
jgi:hypothetical protein